MNETATLITGHTSGLGAAIWEAMESQGATLAGWSLETGVDVTDSASINYAIGEYIADFDVPIGRVINCAGVNHIDWIQNLSYEDWDRLMNTNARAMFGIAKALLERMNEWLTPEERPLLAPDLTILNIVSNASHMPMTHSAAYNASKGAAHILTLQMARELGRRYGWTVFGISPNKLKGTGMSEYIEGRVCELRGWTPSQAEAYQLNALPAGEETCPNALAEFIAFILSSKERHKYLHATVIPYGA